MNHLISVLMLSFFLSSQVIFEFNEKADLSNWKVVDDVVMGGRSSGSFRLNDEGYGVFEGRVSLENNGGFSSVRHQFSELDVTRYSHVVLKLKGDGKNYEFRIRANSKDYYSYIIPFSTSGEWQKIEIPLKDMYPSFRGRRLSLPTFDKAKIEEITFLIANKKNEGFRLLIDKIELR